eukprot:TRINITY_DN63314_c0_g1_i1.p1 TRINITY_DN63314_c0_g1~~TRINITY_DN63314_c0_g1_i1.p1  ORF type:complete len:347 (+),score=58.92 TRINITY_DN63314_c0_g1_i1:31-1041(+)
MFLRSFLRLHGGSGALQPPPVGSLLRLGFDSSRVTAAVGRLLEYHAAGSSQSCQDTLKSVWHPQGKVWIDGKILDFHSSSADAVALSPPSLLSLSFADTRNCLAHVKRMDGRESFLSLLQLDPTQKLSAVHDGWQIVREVVGRASGTDAVQASSETTNASDAAAAAQTVRDYLDLPCTGAPDKEAQVRKLFSKDAVVLGIGDMDIEMLSEVPSLPPWSAPRDELLEVSVDNYVDAVCSQVPHVTDERSRGRIMELKFLSGLDACAATVQVCVGKDAGLSTEHLLLVESCSKQGRKWKIISKTFSVLPPAFRFEHAAGHAHSHGHGHSHGHDHSHSH